MLQETVGARLMGPRRHANLAQDTSTDAAQAFDWYKTSGATKRSMFENAVYRYKTIIGCEMRARTLARQRVEQRIGCEILNKMTAMGMPDSYRVA